MKFLADENIEQPVIDLLRSLGYEVVAVVETIPGASDTEVMRIANIEHCLLLTNDKDFGELVFREMLVSEGIILLRLSAEDGKTKASIIQNILPEIADRLPKHFVVISDEKVRIKPFHIKGE